MAHFKTILRALMYKKRNLKNWDEYITQALITTRTRRNRATGETPAKVLLGYDLTRQGDWQIPKLQERRRRTRADARERRRIIRERQLNFNQKAYPCTDEVPAVTFDVGDKVLLREKNPPDPFAPIWAGPHKIEARKSLVIYEVDKNGRQFQYHVDELRPAPPDPEDPDKGAEGSSDEQADNGVEQAPPTSGTFANRRTRPPIKLAIRRKEDKATGTVE